MHELHVMQKIVRMVEDVCEDQPTGVPSLVRLQIGSHSHLAEHTPQELETTFHLAAQGTRVQEAKLDIAIISAKGRCQGCGITVDRTSDSVMCPTCQSGNIMWEDQPEVMLRQVEWVEEREVP